jgi:flagellar biosynthesis protein FlhG
MSDQADGLRRLMRERGASRVESRAVGEQTSSDPEPIRVHPQRRDKAARSYVFTGGKGGVGTSNLALNIATALGEFGRGVVVIDADFGLANLDLLCGIRPGRDLGDVLAGECDLADTIVQGPGGIRIVPGSHGLKTFVDMLGDGPERLIADLARLESTTEFMFIDAGSGLDAVWSRGGLGADELIVVTTPEPTSVADARVVIQGLRGRAGPMRIRVLVNQANSAAEADDVIARLTASSRRFWGMTIDPLGHVRLDESVREAVRDRTPFVVSTPKSPASRDVRRAARRLIEERAPTRGERPGLIATLAARWALDRVAV